MKRLSILFAVLIATLSSSCNKIEVDENALNYQYVYYGMVLYDLADQSNNYAMDGVNVAVRFGVLLDELDNVGFELKDGETDTFESYYDEELEKDITPDWDDIPLFNDYYDIRKFLIGDTRYVKISRSGDKYTITYDKTTSGYTGGYFDINYRYGSYIIDTKGVSLLESDNTNKWTIKTNDSEEMKIGTSSSTTATATCINYSANVYHTGSGCISFDLYSTFNSGETDADDASWSNFEDPGTITFKGYDSEEEKLLLEDIIEGDIEYTFYGGGETMGGDTVDYETTSPVVFSYSETVNGPTSGAVKASIVGSDATYEVAVSFNFTDGYLFNDTYYYNGYTYIDSYYFY